jgi:hypothetical protein
MLKKRAIELTITKYDQNGKVEFQKEFNSSRSDICPNVKFNFQKYVGSIMYGQGKISICGLDKKSIEVLTGFLSIDSELNKKRVITLKAGYEGEELGLMVDGTIFGALPTIPPDIWLNCDVINNYEQANDKKNFSTSDNLLFTDYIQAVADTLNIKKIENRIKEPSYLNRKISKQAIKAGSMFNIVYSISDVFAINNKYPYGVTAYIENETLIVDYTDLIPNDERIQTPILVNKDNGMIGLPEITNAGQICNITTLLNTSIKTGDVIKMESSQIPSSNGLFYVIGVTYSGEYRGNNWYSVFHCRRVANG